MYLSDDIQKAMDPSDHTLTDVYLLSNPARELSV